MDRSEHGTSVCFGEPFIRTNNLLGIGSAFVSIRYITTNLLRVEVAKVEDISYYKCLQSSTLCCLYNPLASRETLGDIQRDSTEHNTHAHFTIIMAAADMLITMLDTTIRINQVMLLTGIRFLV
jgi:hypothetical protein